MQVYVKFLSQRALESSPMLMLFFPMSQVTNNLVTLVSANPDLVKFKLVMSIETFDFSKFFSSMDFKLIIYCLETPKFNATTNWLQLSTFTVWKPCGYN